MHEPDDEDLSATWLWQAVFNDEDQWALWPEHLPLPDGWTAHGEPGERDAVLAQIEQQWVDMRPRSLR